MPLIDELELLAKNVIELTGKSLDDFKIGYHMSPSMQRLHLHVISTDFNSDYLKTKKHWNSFNTEFFYSTQCKSNSINLTLVRVVIVLGHR